MRVPRRPPAPPEDLERLDELVEVADLDRRVAAEHGRERAVGADERARVRQGGPRGRLRAAHLEAGDGLARLGARAQRVDERLGSAHGLEEEPDRARVRIVGEEGEVVRRVRDRLRTGRDDAAQPDTAAEREERVGDRAGLAEDGDMAGRRRVLRQAVPGGRASGHEEAHAVRPEQRGAELAGTRGEPLRRRRGRRAGLGADSGDDERANSGRRRLLERRLDALVVDHEEGALGYLGQLGDARVAAQAGDLVPVRVHPPGADAARDDGLDRGDVARRRADDGERARGEERADVGHRAHSPRSQVTTCYKRRGAHGSAPKSASCKLSQGLGSRAMAHEKRVEIRWSDVDAYMHVNNAVYATYLEECRDEWVDATLGEAGDSWDFVLARVAIDFRRELRLEDEEVLVSCALARIGNSSVTLSEQIRTRDGELAAEAEAVLVARDREARTLAAADRRRARGIRARAVGSAAMIVPELPADIAALKEAVGRFVESEVYPLEQRIAERGSIDPGELDALRKKARAAGFSMLNMPPELGGRDLSMLGQVALEEESGKATNGLGFAVVDRGPRELHEIATPEQIERYVRPIANGEYREAWALTEPGAGSDLSGARSDGRRATATSGS